jgi:exosome complex component RRP42
VKAALHDLKIPNVRLVSDDKGESDIELTDDPSDCWRLDVSLAPILVTVGKVGMGNVVDLTLEEEVCCKSSLIVGVCETKERQQFITLVKKMRGGSLDPDSLDEMVSLAVRVGVKLQKGFIGRLKAGETSVKEHVGFMAVT